MLARILDSFADALRVRVRDAVAPKVAPCGCCPATGAECATAEALGDDASRKFQTFSSAKGTPFGLAARHTWELARMRYLHHIELAQMSAALAEAR